MQQEESMRIDDINTEVWEHGEDMSHPEAAAQAQCTWNHEIKTDINGDESDVSIDGSDSHESFHSSNEQEYLLPEAIDPVRSESDGKNHVNVNSSGPLMVNIPEDFDSSQCVDPLQHMPLDQQLSENENFMLEKQSFEEAGRVTLYSTRTMGNKARRFQNNRYQGFGIHDNDADDIVGEPPTSGQDEETGNTTKKAYLQNIVSGQTSDTSVYIGSENNNSSIGSDSLSGPPSPTHELRHRSGRSLESPDSKIRKSTLLGGYNRMRSFTSPDTRSSIRNYVRNREVPFQLAQGEQKPLISSLDAGMTVLKRWVTNRSSESSNPRPSRAAARVQMQNYHFDNNTDSELSPGGVNHQVNRTTGDHQRLFIDSRSKNGSVNSGGSGDRSIQRTSVSSPISYPQTIHEEDDTPIRQRANSEPERSQYRPRIGFRRRQEGTVGFGGTYTSLPQSMITRRRRGTDGVSVESLESGGNSLSLDNVLNSGDRPNRVTFNIEPTAETNAQNDDPNREARRNWLVLNRRFQVVVICVGLLCSCLLCSILVTWVVLTSAYVVSIDEGCDLPLKPYFWLATIQLILDVFRKEIMKFLFQFEPSGSQQQIPTRVIVYNLAYLTYAMMVLRIGVSSVFLNRSSTCAQTAASLFKTTRVYVSISLAAWLLILFGYLIPFCVVAIMLTRNGYSPGAEHDQRNQNFGVFPLPNSNNGAPSNCITLLKTLRLEELREDHPRECCICMANFSSDDDIVATECDHVFHKGCCQEWLKQARTCPVCRTDIPASLGMDAGGEGDEPNSSTFEDSLLFSRGPFRSSQFQQELENLVSLLREPRAPG